MADSTETILGVIPPIIATGLVVKLSDKFIPGYRRRRKKKSKKRKKR